MRFRNQILIAFFGLFLAQFAQAQLTCTGPLSFTMPGSTSGSTLSGSTNSVVNVKCFGQSTGGFTITSTGGTPNYTYSWSNGVTTGSTTSIGTAIVTGLPAGSYAVTISDQTGCSLTVSTPTVITQPTAAHQAGICTVAIDACQLGQGQARVEARNGTAPYTVTWTPAQGTPAGPQTIPTSGGSVLISNLRGGVTYNFTVTDANNCRVP